MLFIQVLCIIICTDKTASLSKISTLLHNIDIDDNKLQIEKSVTANIPEEKYDLQFLQNILKAFAPKPLKVMYPTSFITERPPITFVYTRRTFEDPFIDYNNNFVNDANVNSKHGQKSNEDNCETKCDDIFESDNEVIQTEDPLQYIEIINDGVPTETNQEDITDSSTEDDEDCSDNSPQLDEKEFIFFKRSSNSLLAKHSPVNPKVIRLKRSDNVIEEENYSTTASGNKLKGTGSDTSLTYNLLFKNINM